jgi:hypothetical protein
MAGAHQVLTVDEAIRDPTTVVRARVVDDDQPAAEQASDRHLSRTIARRDHHAARDDAEVPERRHTVVRIVAELVDQACSE